MEGSSASTGHATVHAGARPGVAPPRASRRITYSYSSFLPERLRVNYGMSDTIRLVVVCMMLAATLPSAQAQGPYPNQPLRFIVTTAPGGGLDNFSRLVAKELTGRA